MGGKCPSGMDNGPKRDNCHTGVIVLGVIVLVGSSQRGIVVQVGMHKTLSGVLVPRVVVPEVAVHG